MRFVISVFLVTHFACEVLAAQFPDLEIMTYNVENLFDTIDDPHTADETFLPLTAKTARVKKQCRRIKKNRWRNECLQLDWSPKVLSQKMQALAKVVLSRSGGLGPDVLLLQEVENLKVITNWRDQYLKKSKYQTAVLIEGKDQRGIDVAILSRLPLVGRAQLHTIPFAKNDRGREYDSRGILEATLELPNKALMTVFVLHLPAPYHPVRMRLAGLNKLNLLLKSLPPARLVVAGGDFNIPRAEDDEQQIFRKVLAPLWDVSHLVGCRQCQSKSCDQCRGTIYYPPTKTWSFFDVLMFGGALRKQSKKNAAHYYLDPKSIEVVSSAPQQLDRSGLPLSFEPKTGVGASDHLPMSARLKFGTR